MGRCRFNLDMDVYGLPYNKYNIVKIGDKYAKIVKILDETDGYRFVLESRHKNKDFLMVIETVWYLPRERVTFKIEKSVMEIEIFDVVQELYAIPESHINTLKRWYSKQKV